MVPNSKFYERNSLIAQISPVSQGAGTAVSGWISMAAFHEIAAVLTTGVLGASATVDAKFQQATDSSGTGAKDITGKAITQIVKASGDNKGAIVTVRDTDLDVNNGFAFVQFSMTVATAASLIQAVILGTATQYEPASVFNPTAVVQLV